MLKPTKKPLNVPKPRNAAVGFLYKLQGWLEPPVRELPQGIVEKITPKEAAFQQLSFTFSVIALSAHVAAIDGSITREKYLAFREAFPLSGGICLKIRRLFALACENQAPFEHYVTQIKYIFPRRMALFKSLVDRLFSIAGAGGAISREAERMLAKVAHMLELSASEYTDIRDRHVHPPKAHEVLGVSKRTSSNKLKKHYRELMRRYHPDRFGAESLSPEVEMLLQLKTSEINAAYRHLSKQAA